jgi:hypothetical protein
VLYDLFESSAKTANRLKTGNISVFLSQQKTKRATGKHPRNHGNTTQTKVENTNKSGIIREQVRDCLNPVSLQQYKKGFIVYLLTLIDTANVSSIPPSKEFCRCTAPQTSQWRPSSAPTDSGTSHSLSDVGLPLEITSNRTLFAVFVIWSMLSTVCRSSSVLAAKFSMSPDVVEPLSAG